MLLFLVTGKEGFHESKKYYELYDKYIDGINIDNKLNEYFEDYWTNEVDPHSQLSVEFKELYKKMISFNPGERPDFKTIKSHSWFNDMKNKNLNDKLKEELKKELKDRLDIININNTLKLETNEEEFIKSEDGRAMNDNEKIYFKGDIKPKLADEKMNMDNCIIIKGYLDGNAFMNSLCGKIRTENEGKCFIEASKT